MSALIVDYATPSAFDADRSRAHLALTANARRPVRFRGRVRRHIPLLRFALRALGEAIWSSAGWLADEEVSFLLDPIITVHPDRLIFEAFSQDQSSFVRLDVDPALFEIDGPVEYGTTNVDFTAWLWGALGELRSSRETELRIETAGFQVASGGAGGRFEAKVEVPDSWVRGLLQVQAAMTFPGTRLALRPVDLLAAIRFLRYTNAKVSPRALRYEMEPDQDARIVLEPWEQVIPLRGAQHGYSEPRTIRTWGRQRLKLLEPLLPFADGVRVYLKGRSLPSFYAVDLPGMTFLFGLSGFAGNRWTSSIGLDLMSAARALPADDLARCLELLAGRVKLDAGEVAAGLGVERRHATLLLDRLARQGRVMFDLETREYRHRELFETPPDEAVLYPRDTRLEDAAAYLEGEQVRLVQCEPEETRSTRRFKTEHGRLEREVVYRDWRAAAAVADQPAVTIVLSDSGQLIFGECGCTFFRENLLNRGPCAHMLALYQTVSHSLTDPPSSQPAEHPPERPFRDPRTGEQTYGARWGDADVDKDDDDGDKAV
jgi:hypothetical protein